MKITVIITEEDLKAMIRERLVKELPEVPEGQFNISYEVSSKVNYKNEWEAGRMRATVTYDK